MSEGFLLNPREFKFELVSPEKVEISSTEERVVLPGEEGDFMVLAGHTPLLAGLRPGIVSVIHANNNVIRYFITGGFADVDNQHCTVLTPHIMPVIRFSIEKLTKELERLEEQLSAATEAHEIDHLTSERDMTALKLEIAEKYNA